MALVNIPIGRWLGLQHYPRVGIETGALNFLPGLLEFGPYVDTIIVIETDYQ